MRKALVYSPWLVCTWNTLSIFSIFCASIPSFTCTWKCSAVACKYAAYSSPDGCCVCKENAGDVSGDIAFRSTALKKLPQKDGEIKRLYFGHALNDEPMVLRSIIV